MRIITAGGDAHDVFKLDKINHWLIGYYIDATGNVYSTRQSKNKVPYRLKGSLQSGRRYFTLAGRSYSQMELLSCAKKNASFYTEVGEPKISPNHQIPSNPRAHAETFAAGIKAKGMMIGSILKTESGDTLLLAHAPKVHLTEASWKAEIERLAKSQPGVKFVALQVVGTCVAGAVVFE